MKEYNKEEIVLALGFFDGVHKGHQKLIRKTKEIAKVHHCSTGVLTFKEHPLKAIFPSYAPWLLTDNKTKTLLLHKMGIDYVFLNDFDDALRRLTPEAFIKDYLITRYNVCHVVVGYNYTFGYKGEGNTELLKNLSQKYNFGLTVVPPFSLNGDMVSSTLIRELISTGDVDEAANFLGRAHCITGEVVSGKKLGKTFSIPTANLKMKSQVILPSSGVYFSQVSIDGKKYDGSTNLGYNPTFEGHPYSIETYIFDFDENIYGKEIVLCFKEKIRKELKFKSVNDLIKQIRSDINLINDHYR